MKTVDISNWGEILVSDLFEHIERGKGSGAGSFLDGETPYIAASFANNGYVRDVDDAEGTLTSDGNCIAMIVNGNGGVGRNTYQAEPFVGSSDLQLGYHRRLNQWSGLFLVACLNKSIERYNYSFAWKRTGDAFARETVFLPVLANGSPDWDAMEQAMRSVIENQKKKLTFIERLKATPHTSIDVSSWGEFKIGDLFDSIKRAKRRTVNSYEPGDTPYVTNSAFNNGVSRYLMPKSERDIEIGQCISVNTVDGSAFWQEEDFLANSSGNGLLLLRREDLNPLRALFLCTAIKRSLDPSFTVMLTKGVVKSATIKLPVDAAGAPDWAYMESVMKALLEQKTADLDVLEQLLPPSEESEVI